MDAYGTIVSNGVRKERERGGVETEGGVTYLCSSCSSSVFWSIQSLYLKRKTYVVSPRPPQLREYPASNGKKLANLFRRMVDTPFLSASTFACLIGGVAISAVGGGLQLFYTIEN